MITTSYSLKKSCGFCNYLVCTVPVNYYWQIYIEPVKKVINSALDACEEKVFLRDQAFFLLPFNNDFFM